MKHFRMLCVLALGCLTLVVVGVAHANIGAPHAKAKRQSHFCTRHPNAPRCNPAPTPASTATSTPTAPSSPTSTSAPTTPSSPTSTSTPNTPSSPTSTSTPTTPSTPTSTTTPTATATPSQSGTCQDANAKYIWNNWQNGPVGAYYADADWWATNGYTFAQKTVICDYNSWYVQATADNSKGDGAVKSYPNVHRDFHDWGTGHEPAISSFNTMTSQFAHTSPGVGIYDVAYDIWLNGVADSNSTELMIWTDNHNQVPSGSKVGQVTLSGHTWDVWSSDANHYIAFVPANGASITSGTLDLLGFYKYLISGGRLPASSTVGQVDYGVEIVSTDGKPARWDFTNFNVSSS